MSDPSPPSPIPRLFGLALRLAVPALLLGVGAGCANKIDRMTIDNVFSRAATIPDLQRSCAMGEALGIPLEAVTHPDNPPTRARILSDASAALCSEIEAREAQLEVARVEANFAGLGTDHLIAMVRDAREGESRARQVAARRYRRAWDDLEALWGPIGEGCPRVRERDEIVLLMGLNAGINGLLHDRASGATVDFPLDVLPKVARASECLDDTRWWYLPQAMRAAAWATVPGSAPDGVDPWELLEDAAVNGEARGIRLARAVQVVIAANNGREEVVASGIEAFASSWAETPPDPDFALFDDYALALVRHESDLLWTRAEGHRTLDLGTLPGAGSAPEVLGDDPFGGDPFGGDASDPFDDADPSDDAEPTEDPTPDAPEEE